MQDTEGYIRKIKRLKEKYTGKIQLYLGVEEDCGEYVGRSRFEYLIGSVHYIFADMKRLLREVGFVYTYILYDNEWKKDYL